MKFNNLSQSCGNFISVLYNQMKWNKIEKFEYQNKWNVDEKKWNLVVKKLYSRDAHFAVRGMSSKFTGCHQLHKTKCDSVAS